MEELVKAISDKTGLPEDQARAAAEAAVDFIKTKLPPPYDKQVDALLGGGDAAGGITGSISQGLGGLFGKK